MKKYVCTVCDWVYDPKIGDPDGGIEPGTSFEDIPDDWVCPLCGVGKDMFVEMQSLKQIVNDFMEKYICTKCNWIYDPIVGDPKGNVVPGTPFENLPEDWVCPQCGATKDKFREL